MYIYRTGFSIVSRHLSLYGIGFVVYASHHSHDGSDGMGWGGNVPESTRDEMKRRMDGVSHRWRLACAGAGAGLIDAEV